MNNPQKANFKEIRVHVKSKSPLLFDKQHYQRLLEVLQRLNVFSPENCGITPLSSAKNKSRRNT